MTSIKHRIAALLLATLLATAGAMAASATFAAKDAHAILGHGHVTIDG